MSVVQGLAWAARRALQPSAGTMQRSFATFPSWLPEAKGGSPRLTTPLNDPLPGVMSVPPFRAPTEPPPTEVTVLSNGVRIISEATPVGAD